MDEGDVPAAEHWFRQAILIKEDFRAALFNLALLLADDHRPLQAAPFLNQLVRFHPDHVKALILLGDIYINNIKDLDAAENVSLFTAEPLQPCHAFDLFNPCVVTFPVLPEDTTTGSRQHARNAQPMRGVCRTWPSEGGRNLLTKSPSDGPS